MRVEHTQEIVKEMEVAATYHRLRQTHCRDLEQQYEQETKKRKYGLVDVRSSSYELRRSKK